MVRPGDGDCLTRLMSIFTLNQNISSLCVLSNIRNTTSGIRPSKLSRANLVLSDKLAHPPQILRSSHLQLEGLVTGDQFSGIITSLDERLTIPDIRSCH